MDMELDGNSDRNGDSDSHIPVKGWSVCRKFYAMPQLPFAL